MSLDVYLECAGSHKVECPHCRSTYDSSDELYEANITHNLNTMADQAGIYKALWRPEELGFTKAGELVPLLREGLDKLQVAPDFYRKFNPENGWGDYDGLVRFVTNYLAACERYPDATIRISR
jgi:hypothetical protein